MYQIHGSGDEDFVTYMGMAAILFSDAVPFNKLSKPIRQKAKW